MINPGSRPLVDAEEHLASDVLAALLAAVRIRAEELQQVPIRHRVAGISGEPARVPDGDQDGRFAWDVPISDGTHVRILIPGVPLQQVRDDLSAEAPVLYVAGEAAWWTAAVDSLAGIGMRLR